MSDYGEVVEPGTVRIERLLPGPIERVWAYLTDVDKRATWLAGGLLEQVTDKVRLTVTHRRIPTRGEMLDIATGWHTHLDVLQARLATSPPDAFWPKFTSLRAEYESLLPPESPDRG